jgi:hypothetical protein
LQKNFNPIDYSLYPSLNDLNKPKLIEEKISSKVITLPVLGLTIPTIFKFILN